MLSDSKATLQRLGQATLILASLLLLLYVLNLRSRVYNNGPDCGFLLWLFVWAATTGIGLLRLRKWALVLLFFPGIAFTVILSAGLVRSSGIATWAIAINVLFVALTVAVPIVLLRFWNTLRW
jgi:hypothetical protein